MIDKVVNVFNNKLSIHLFFMFINLCAILISDFANKKVAAFIVMLVFVASGLINYFYIDSHKKSEQDKQERLFDDWEKLVDSL